MADGSEKEDKKDERHEGHGRAVEGKDGKDKVKKITWLRYVKGKKQKMKEKIRKKEETAIRNQIATPSMEPLARSKQSGTSKITFTDYYKTI